MQGFPISLASRVTEADETGLENCYRFEKDHELGRKTSSDLPYGAAQQ